MQVSQNTTHAAYVYQVWAAVGPLVGVVVGAWLAARWQRRRWILDNKTAEYRGLFDALSTYRFTLTQYHADYEYAMVAVSAQKQYDDDVALAKAMAAATNAFADRIFTRQSILKSGARGDWSDYTRKQVSEKPPDITSA